MPTPPQSYSPTAAEKLRRTLLVLAATAATTGCDLSFSDPFPARTLGVPLPPQPSDSDGDGILDEDEILLLGTDPSNPDTDGDGLKDGEEVKSFATNPLNPDTDGDGRKDGEEVEQFHTDPLNPDSDGVILGGEPPMMPGPSTNAPSAAPVPIELTEEDREKLESAGLDVSAATNAAARP